jgi:hypothetical protein
VYVSLLEWEDPLVSAPRFAGVRPHPLPACQSSPANPPSNQTVLLFACKLAHDMQPRALR